MKILVLAVLIAAIAYSAWSVSDCNNSAPSMLKEHQSKYCMCSKFMIKVQGVNESKCVTPHADSMMPCTAYDHCSLPEQCVRQTQTEFACRYVQSGCYDAMDIGNVIRQKCL